MPDTALKSREKLVEVNAEDLKIGMDVTSEYTNEVLFIDKGLEPGSFGIDPAEYFLE